MTDTLYLDDRINDVEEKVNEIDEKMDKLLEMVKDLSGRAVPVYVEPHLAEQAISELNEALRKGGKITIE